MAVSKEQKALYNTKVKPYKECLSDLKKEISTLTGASKRNAKLKPYMMVQNAILGIKTANTLVMMSRLSMEIQNLKKEDDLNNARKEISGRLTDLTGVVGNEIDGSLTENQEALAKVAMLNPAQRLHLLQAFREAIGVVKTTMGDTSKWRWYFPDLHYRLVVLTKNLLDFKAFDKAKDPREDFYRDRQEMMQFLIEEIRSAAQEYRSKYELSTREVGDLTPIRKLFELEKKVHIMTGNKEELGRTQTSLDAINEKIEAIMAEKKGKKKKKKK